MGLETEKRETCYCDLCERFMDEDDGYRRCCICGKYACSTCSEDSSYGSDDYITLCYGCAKTHSFCTKVINKKTGKVVEHTEWD